MMMFRKKYLQLYCGGCGVIPVKKLLGNTALWDSIFHGPILAGLSAAALELRHCTIHLTFDWSRCTLAMEQMPGAAAHLREIILFSGVYPLDRCAVIKKRKQNLSKGSVCLLKIIKGAIVVKKVELFSKLSSSSCPLNYGHTHCKVLGVYIHVYRMQSCHTLSCSEL